MGVTPADVANLNNSFQNLGNTFRQGRLDEEAKRKDMEQELLRRQMNEATKQHYAAEEEHYKGETARADRSETRQSDVMKHAQAQQALQGLQKAHDSLSKNVATGTMTPEQAKAAAKRIVDQVKSGTDEILKNSPFAALMDDPNADIFSQPPEKTTPRLPAAGIQYVQKADELEQQANDAEDDDPEGAAKLREAATLLRNHLQKSQQRGPSAYRENITRDKSGNVVSKERLPIDATTGTATGAPKPGEVRKGYRFKGGDPAVKGNWEKAQ